MDTITATNFILCVVIVVLGIMVYGRKKVAMPLLIGVAFGLFGISHLANLLGFARAWESSLVVIRTLGYLIVIYALFRLALAPYSKL